MSRHKILVGGTLTLLCCWTTRGHAAPRSEPPQKYSGLPSGQPIINPEFFRISFQSMEMSKEGEKLIQAKKWQEGERRFRDAINTWGDNRQAHYGLAQCCLEQGKSSEAIEQYRLCVYHKTDSGVVLGGYPHQPFELALLLSKAGLSDEACFVYNTALLNLNYHDNKQHLKVLLPEFGLKQAQRTYIPAHFQAMAHVAIAQTISDEPKASEHLKEAVRVYPKSGVAHFYLAEVLRHTSPEEARATYTKAKQLDPRAIGKEADKAMTTGDLYRPGDPDPGVTLNPVP